MGEKFRKYEWVAVLVEGKYYVGGIVDSINDGAAYSVAFAPLMPPIVVGVDRLMKAAVLIEGTGDLMQTDEGDDGYAPKCQCGDCVAEDAKRLPGFYVVRAENDIPTATHRRPYHSLRMARENANGRNAENNGWHWVMWWDGTGFLKQKPA